MRRLLCPRCGEAGESEDGTHFELVGRYGRKPLVRCLGCDWGLVLGALGGVRPLEPEDWGRVESMRAREGLTPVAPDVEAAAEEAVASVAASLRSVVAANVTPPVVARVYEAALWAAEPVFLRIGRASSWRYRGEVGLVRDGLVSIAALAVAYALYDSSCAAALARQAKWNGRGVRQHASAIFLDAVDGGDGLAMAILEGLVTAEETDFSERRLALAGIFDGLHVPYGGLPWFRAFAAATVAFHGLREAADVVALAVADPGDEPADPS